MSPSIPAIESFSTLARIAREMQCHINALQPAQQARTTTAVVAALREYEAAYPLISERDRRNLALSAAAELNRLGLSDPWHEDLAGRLVAALGDLSKRRTDDIEAEPDMEYFGVSPEVGEAECRLVELGRLLARNGIGLQELVADPSATPERANGTLVAAPEQAPQAPPATQSESDMTWQQAAERLKQLRSQGERWTSYEKMSEQLHCSSSTVHKAVEKTPELQSWAKRDSTSAPKAQSFTPPSKKGDGYSNMLTDATPQDREPDPADEAAIREFIETAEPDIRAWFLALPREEQLAYLNDPDKHPKILGRKP